MKKIYLYIICIILINSQIFSQWSLQNSNSTDNFIHVKFVSDSIGWISTGYGVGPGYKLYKTTNEGNSWSIQKNFSPECVMSFDFRNKSTGWLLSYYNGSTKIYKTLNGGIDWQIKDTLTSTLLTEIKFVNDSVGWCVGSGGAPSTPVAIKTVDGGNSWKSILVPLTHFDLFSCVDFINESEGWIGGFGDLFKTSDGGENWIELPFINLSTALSKIQFVNSNTGWVSTDSGGLFKTTDGGNSWTQQSIKSLNFHFVNDKIGWSVNGSSINYTVDGGKIWTIQNSNTNNFLWDISFVNMYSGWVVGDSGIILHTQNSGTPVELMNFMAKLENNLVRLEWSTASEINNQGFFVERKKQNESNWESLTFIKGKGTTTFINHYTYKDVPIHSAKYKYRLKQIDFDGTVKLSNEIEIKFSQIPARFKLYKNYPNPFNPSTIIEYQIPQAAHVSLKIYDILGHVVSTLINEEKNAGSYKVQFDAKRFASGVYIYQLKAGNYISARKMILLK